MKKIIFAASLIFGALLVGAQDTYTIKMSMKVDGMPPEYAAYGEQDIVTYVKGEKTKMEITSMMGSNTSYFDGKKLTSLSDAMGNKTGYTATKEELEAGDKKESAAKPTIEYTGEKKTIAGYECTKALVKSVDKEKKESVVTVWFTEKLKGPSAEARKVRKGAFDLGDLKGQPLAVEASQSSQGMELKIMMTATEVNTADIDDALFVPNTEGYKMFGYKDYLEKMKAMQGGK